MPFLPVKTDDGMFAAPDDSGPAASSVVNWEVDETGVNRPRPGYIQHTLNNFTTDPIIGLEEWKGYLIIVTESATGVRRLWAVNSSAPDNASPLSDASDSTTLLGDYKRPVFAQGSTYVYVTGGGNVVYWGPSMVRAATLSSSPLCTHIAATGQRLVANTSVNLNYYQWSDIGEGAWSTWPAANVADADARPDAVVGIYENISETFVFGTSTLQVFTTGSDPTYPFDVISTINTGLGAPYAVVRLDETFAFLDNSRRIVISDGRSIKDISQAIHYSLRSMADVSDAFGWREERSSQSLLCWCFPTAGVTWVYDMKADRWTQRAFYSSPFQTNFPALCAANWSARGFYVFGHSSGGLYRLSEGTVSDQGSAPIVCERTTGWTDHGLQGRKRSLRVRCTLRRGTAAINATPGMIEVRVQNDDRPWGEWKQISIGGPSDYKNRVDLFFGGVFSRRRYQIRYTNTDATALVSVSDELMEVSG